MNRKIICACIGLLIFSTVVSAAGIMIGNRGYINHISTRRDILPDDIAPIILDDDFYQGAPRDHVCFNIVELSLDILTLNIGYSGGCEDHDFALVGPTTFMESNPVQTIIVLSHDDHNDPCDAWLTEELSFDLTPLKELWQQYYQQESGTIIIWLEEFEEPIIYEFY